MPLKHVKAGPNNVDAYRISGVPFLSASTLSSNDTHQVDLPSTTKFIKIKNDETDTNSRLSFGITLSGTLSSSAGGEGNFIFNISGNSSETFEIRTKTFFLSNSAGNTTDGSLKYQVCAGLTLIDQFPVLTASNEFKGVG